MNGISWNTGYDVLNLPESNFMPFWFSCYTKFKAIVLVFGLEDLSSTFFKCS